MCQSGTILWILMHVNFEKGIEIHCKVSQFLSLSGLIIFLPKEPFKPLSHWGTYPGRDYLECGGCQSLWCKGRLVDGVMTIKNTNCSPSWQGSFVCLTSKTVWVIWIAVYHFPRGTSSLLVNHSSIWISCQYIADLF